MKKGGQETSNQEARVTQAKWIWESSRIITGGILQTNNQPSTKIVER